jgi:protein-S-isoprenylcysteine O-methyltransferase Ste14
MASKMSVFGAGHKIAVATVPTVAFCAAAAWRYGESFHYGGMPVPMLLGAGVGLIVVGLTVNFVAAFSMLRAFRQQRLLTSGIYSLSRNPMYASFIFLTIPGISLALNCWVMLGTSVALYVATSHFVVEEEWWLAERFGSKWEQYAQEVGRIFPKVW